MDIDLPKNLKELMTPDKNLTCTYPPQDEKSLDPTTPAITPHSHQLQLHRPPLQIGAQLQPQGVMGYRNPVIRGGG